MGLFFGKAVQLFAAFGHLQLVVAFFVVGDGQWEILNQLELDDRLVVGAKGDGWGEGCGQVGQNGHGIGFFERLFGFEDGTPPLCRSGEVDGWRGGF